MNEKLVFLVSVCDLGPLVQSVSRWATKVGERKV